MNAQYDNYDKPWKVGLENLFEFFMAFFFPEVHACIDWNRGYEFLDKEFMQLLEEAKLSRREVDKLVRVWLKDGGEVWVLIHVEIQSQRIEDFAMRMFRYNSLIYLRYNHKVASFAILGDDDPGWKPDNIDYTLFGKKVSFPYWTSKLLDYLPHWEELETSLNPFAIMAMAHLKTLETRKDPQKRLQWKYTITRSLLQKGFPLDVIRYIFNFIDVIMRLPKDLEIDFRKKVISDEENNIMTRTMIPYEEVAFEEGFKQGEEQGITQGIAKGIRESIQDILVARFDSVPVNLYIVIQTMVDIPFLKSLIITAAITDSLKEIKKVIWNKIMTDKAE